MANHKSALKRSNQSIKRNIANKAKLSQGRNLVKQLRKLILEKNSEEAKSLLNRTQSILANLGSKRIIPRNTVSRLTSRLSSQVAKINTTTAPTA